MKGIEDCGSHFVACPGSLTDRGSFVFVFLLLHLMVFGFGMAHYGFKVRIAVGG